MQGRDACGKFVLLVACQNMSWHVVRVNIRTVCDAGTAQTMQVFGGAVRGAFLSNAVAHLRAGSDDTLCWLPGADECES